MNLNIHYSDLSAIIKKKSGKDILLNYTDSKTINVGYDVLVPIIGSKHIGLDLTVEKIIRNDIYLNFGTAASLIIGGFLSLIKDQSIVEKQDHYVIIHLDQIEKAEKALETFTLNDISFSEEEIIVGVGVKD